MPLSPNEATVVQRLEAWKSKVDDLLAMYDGQGHIPRSDVPLARERYADLKRGLEAEYRLNASSRRRPPLTAAEQAYYVPYIAEVYCDLAPINAKPERWCDSLYSAQDRLSGAILPLKGRR